MSRVQGYRPVVEYCGGTEIGGGFLSGTLLQPACAATFSTPTLGAGLLLLGTDGSQSAHGSGAGPCIG
jgi:acetyl-CoA synthetase